MLYAAALGVFAYWSYHVAQRQLQDRDLAEYYRLCAQEGALGETITQREPLPPSRSGVLRDFAFITKLLFSLVVISAMILLLLIPSSLPVDGV